MALRSVPGGDVALEKGATPLDIALCSARALAYGSDGLANKHGYNDCHGRARQTKGKSCEGVACSAHRVSAARFYMTLSLC